MTHNLTSNIRKVKLKNIIGGAQYVAQKANLRISSIRFPGSYSGNSTKCMFFIDSYTGSDDCKTAGYYSSSCYYTSPGRNSGSSHFTGPGYNPGSSYYSACGSGSNQTYRFLLFATCPYVIRNDGRYDEGNPR